MSADARRGGTEPATFDASVELLADGSVAVLRPVVPSDRDALLRLHSDASDSSIYYRFFSASRSAADTFAGHVCDPSPTTWSLVAERRGSMLGLATASLDQDGDAEVALLVADQVHGLGVGTVLLERLAEWSRLRGVRAFTAEVLGSNFPMLRVFRDSGFEFTQHWDHGVVDVRLDLTPSPVSQTAHDTRWRSAEHQSLAPLLEPSSVAVIGVSRRRGRVGREVLENLVSGGFDGELYAVGRSGLDVEGVHCVHDTTALPRDLDLVVVAVAAGDVERVLLQVAQRGARTAVILTAGLGEAAESGRQAEARLRELAAAYGMRLVGPNCFGVVSNLRGTRLDATFGRSRARAGGLAIGSQSGGVGVAILDAVHRRGAGLACFVSLGNKVDVSGNDLLAAWRDDPDVTAAGLYLESFLDPRRFVRVASDFSRRKPLLVTFGGSSPAGVRAGKSHTAASATPDRVLSAMLRACGAIRVEGVDEMVDTCALLIEQPVTRGPRVALLSNAGGLGIMAADAAQRSGLVVPDLAERSDLQLSALLPHASSTANPVDLGAAADADAFSTALGALTRSEEVDAVLVVIVETAVTDLDAVCASVENAAGPAESREVPVLSVVIGREVPEATTSCRFSSIESALGALVHTVDYGTWLREPDTGLSFVVPGPTGAATRTGAEGWLDTTSASQLVSETGLTLPPQRVAEDAEDAVAAAAEIGYPVVVKLAAADVVHKTEAHGVWPGLRDATDVRCAASALLELQVSGGLLLVQREVSGPALAVGLTQDARFGPLLMIASGGTSLDLWGDHVFLMPPLRRGEIRDALRTLRTWPLLTGFRGSVPVDVDAVIDLVDTVGRLGLTRPDIVELDLNPVICTPEGPVCVDVKVRRG